MKGTTVVKKIDTKKPYHIEIFNDDEERKVRPKDKVFFYLEPYFGFSNQERFFNVKKVDDGYELEGEVYFVAKENVLNHIKKLKTKLADDKAKVEFRLVNNDGKTLTLASSEKTLSLFSKRLWSGKIPSSKSQKYSLCQAHTSKRRPLIFSMMRQEKSCLFTRSWNSAGSSI